MSLENEWCVLILEGHVETTDFHSLKALRRKRKTWNDKVSELDKSLNNSIIYLLWI